MSDLDLQLAALLRRAPPAPAALDAAHRLAVLAAARQSWFRQRARSRRNLLGLAAAALFAAAIAGWTIRSLVDGPVWTAAPVVVAADRPAAPAPAAPAPAAAIPPPAPMAAPAEMVADAAANGVAREAGPERRALRVGAPTMAKARSATAATEVDSPPPMRGRLIMAGLVLDAALAGRLADTDRQPALQAALDSLAGLAGPEAEALRLRLRAALAQP